MDQGSRFDAGALRAAGTAILTARGADPACADTVLDVLLEAERRGVVTHGLTRLASYVERIDLGQLDPRARPSRVVDAGALVLSGGGFSTAVRGATDVSGPADVTFTVIAADIARLMPGAEYRRRVQDFRDIVHEAGDGNPQVGLPGRLELEHMRDVDANGIALAPDVVAALERLCGGPRG